MIVLGVAYLGLSVYGQCGCRRRTRERRAGIRLVQVVRFEGHGIPARTARGCHDLHQRTGRRLPVHRPAAYVLPDRVDPVTAEARPGFDRGMAQLQADVRAGRRSWPCSAAATACPGCARSSSSGLYLAAQVGRRGDLPARRRERADEDPGEVRPQGRTALVTGGGGLLGESSAGRWRSRRAVAIAGIDADAAAECRMAWPKPGYHDQAVECDITRRRIRRSRCSRRCSRSSAGSTSW